MHAGQIDALRDTLAPAALPVSFAPAGADPVSAAAATSISAKAAEAANGLWAVWSALGKVSGTLRANATNYLAQEAVSTAALSGSGSASAAPIASAPPVLPAPVAVPTVHAVPPAATPEHLSVLLRDGAGASSPAGFGQVWSAHAAGIDDVIVDLGNTRSSLADSWSGDAADGADQDLASAHSTLTTQHGRVAAVGDTAAAHSATYQTTVDNTPEPAQFADWHQQLDSAVAANDAYPGVYTGAVLDAQSQLSAGYTQTGEAYGQYATDPVTGQPIDPTTGQPIDPLTGRPIDPTADGGDAADSADGQDPLSSGGELLTGLLGGLVGAAGAGVGAVTQGIQQAVQMATQGVGEITKGIAQGAGPKPGSDPADLGDLGGVGDGGGSDGGGGGIGGGGDGGGGLTPAAATLIGSAPSAPAAEPAAAVSAGPAAAAAEGGPGMGGMPMMPMGGGGVGGAGPKASASESNRFLPPRRPNTQRVIGAAETERVAAKRNSRDQRLKGLQAAQGAGETKEETAP